jgi:4-carboxymuconolactone decarboxylase
MRRKPKKWKKQAMADNDLFAKGLKTRKRVLGSKYVDANLAGSDDFMMTFQRAATELAWGYAWSRPGLDQKTRSILTLGILAGLGCFQELGIYTNAGVASGVTLEEIKEALVPDHRLRRDAGRSPGIPGGTRPRMPTACSRWAPWR